MNDPLKRFEEEHQEALGRLRELESAATSLRASDDVEESLATARDVHGFLSTAVREHNENEERALFGHLGDEAPTELFVEEHGTLRSLEGDLSAAIESGDPDAVARSAFAVIETLRAHIDREDNMLFPMARDLLGRDGLNRVARALEELDRPADA